MAGIEVDALGDHLARKRGTLAAAVGRGIEAPAPLTAALGPNPAAPYSGGPVASGPVADDKYPATEAFNSASGIQREPMPARPVAQAITPSGHPAPQGIMAPAPAVPVDKYAAVTPSGFGVPVAQPTLGITAPEPSSPPAAPVAQSAPQPAAPVGQSLTTPSAASMPAHPNAATADPNKILFNASKGIDGTGIMQPATTVKNGNLAAGLANKDSKGVTANGTGGNNLGDTASIVQGIMAGGSTTDVAHGITGPGQSPLLEMRGALDPAAAQAIHNRVDFSAGSVNDPAANAKYADEVQKAMRVNAANGIAPTSGQIKTVGASNADVVNLLSANNQNGQFSKGIEAMQTQQAADAVTAKTEAEGITAMGNRTKAQAEARLDDAKAKALSSGYGKLAEVKGKISEDGKPILRNEHGQRYTLDDQNQPVPYLGKEVGEVKALTAHQQWQQDQVKKKEDMAGKSTEELAKMLVSGDVAPSELSDRAGQRAAAMIAAKKMDPNFSAQKADVNYGLKKNAAFRTREMTAEALPEIMRNVVEAGKKVNYDDVKFKGAIEKWSKGQMNDPALTEYMVQRNDALMTIAAAMRGNGATDMAHAAETEAMAPTLSPKALDAWMSGQMKSLVPRLQQYQNLGMKPKIIDPLTGNPTDQPVEQGMVVDPATGKVIVSRGDLPAKSVGQDIAASAQRQMWKKPGTNSVPMDAVNELKQDPSPAAKKEFDAHFGVGYAAAVLKR